MKLIEEISELGNSEDREDSEVVLQGKDREENLEATEDVMRNSNLKENMVEAEDTEEEDLVDLQKAEMILR